MVRKWWDILRLRRLGAEPQLIADVAKHGSLEAASINYERRILSLCDQIRKQGIVW